MTDVNVTLLNMTHSWCGSLIFRLRHAGQTVTLADNIGEDTPGAGIGDSFNFNGNYTFDSESTLSIWTAAAAVGNAAAVPSGIYDTSDETTGQGNSVLDLFRGHSSAGTWTLEIEQTTGSLDSGALASWRLELTPEPGSLLLLSLAGLRLRRRD